MEDDIAECKSEVQIQSVKVKEKEQECKIYDMKIKEIKRLMPHKTLRPIGLRYSKIQSKVKATTFYSNGVGSTRKPFQSTGMTTITTSESHKNQALFLTNLKQQGNFLMKYRNFSFF